MADDGEDPNLPGNRWRYLQKRRVEERQDFINRKLMPDPNARYRLDEAITMKGVCEDMCPELERHEREAKALIDPWEYLGGPNTTMRPRRIDHEKACKAYQRASGDLAIPSDLRTVPACIRTTKYLWRMIAKHGLPHVHAFVRDRTRAVRQDLRIQLEVPPGISIFQQCVRFHILSLHALRHLPGDRFDFGTEAEQIAQTLQSLKELSKEYGGIHPIADTPEFLGYYILFHVRNTHEELKNKQLINSSLCLKFAAQLRQSVAANSPPFGKNSVLKVGADGIARWDEFIAAMESPTVASNYPESKWSPLHRRAAIFLFGCLLEWHFGPGNVSQLAERRRSVVDGVDRGVMNIEDNTGDHDLRIIECDVEDGSSHFVASKAAASSLPANSQLQSTTLNAFASPFVPTAQSSPQRNGLESVAPAFANPTPSASPFTSSPASQPPSSSLAPTPSDPFRSSSPVGDTRTNAFASAFSREPSPGNANAFFPSSRGASPAPSANPFGAGGSVFGPKSTSAFGTSSPFAAPASSTTAPAFAPKTTPSPSPFGSPFSSTTQQVQPPPQLAPIETSSLNPQQDEEYDELIITPPSPERPLPSVTEPTPAAPAVPAESSKAPSIFVTQASPTPPASSLFSNPAPSFEPLAPRPFVPKRSSPLASNPSFAQSPPASPQAVPPPRATTTPATIGSSSLFNSPFSSAPSFPAAQPTKAPFFPPGKGSTLPTLTPSAPFIAPTPRALRPEHTPKAASTSAPFQKKKDLPLDTELMYAILLRTITAAHVSETIADEFSRRRVVRAVRPMWNSWVTRVRRKTDRRKREVERALEWEKEVEQGRRVRRRLADEHTSVGVKRAKESGKEEIGKNVVDRGEKRRKYWEAGSFLGTLRRHVEESLALEGDLSSGYPKLWTVHLSSNERFPTSAVWIKTKFGLEGDGTKGRNYLAISLTGEIIEGKKDSPGLVVFETTPLESDLALEDRSRILENDCARLRAVMEALSPERHYSTSLVVVLWGQDSPLPISATAQGVGLDSSQVTLLHLGGGQGGDDPDNDFRRALKKIRLDVVGERVSNLSVRDLTKRLVDIWSDGLENTVALCRGADHFNWQLAGYVLSSSVQLLNTIATTVNRFVTTQTQTRYEEWKLPTFDGSRFGLDTEKNLHALDEYLKKDVFADDGDAEGLRISLAARGGSLGRDYTGTTLLSFARGLAQILLDRLEGTLVTPHLSKTLLLTYTSNGGVQSLRLRIPKSRMTALENTFKRDVEKATSDLGVLRRSVAAGVWAKTVEIQKREREAREEIDNSAARSVNGSPQGKEKISSQPPLTLEDLQPLPRTSSVTSTSLPNPSPLAAHGLALPGLSRPSSMQLAPSRPDARPIQPRSAAQPGTIGALRSRAQEILAKYKGQNGESMPNSPTGLSHPNEDSSPAIYDSALGVSSSSSGSGTSINGRASFGSGSGSMASYPFGVRKRVSYTDLLQRKTDDVLNSSVRKWGEKSS